MSGSGTATHPNRNQRELVYCHECLEEWYRERTGELRCPRCQSDFTEVIDPQFDPRAEVAEPNPLASHNPWAADPDESNQDDLGYGTGRRSNSGVPSGRNLHGFPSPFGHPQDAFGQPPDLFPPLFGSFANMLQGMTGARPTPFGFPGAPLHQHESDPRSRSAPGSQPRQTAPRLNVWTTSGPGFSFTTHSSSRTFSNGGVRTDGQPVDPQDINMIMEGIFRNMALPGAPGSAPRGGGPANPFASLFNTLLNPANAAHGDAVFSQEAFDRVMSQLMEEHISGNAPGPASNAAIHALPKKKVTENMLDETTKTADCSICMDEVTIGDEVTSLPCGHWFHFPCVEAWLKEHDTCPVCRAGIMPKEGDRDTVRTSAQAPLHDEDPFLLARRESGTREHPFVVPESPTRERRHPNPRRHSGSEAHASSSRRPSEREDDGGGITGRMRSFFGTGRGSNSKRS